MSVLSDALTKLTLFPNGVGQGVTAIIGGTAGDHTVTGIKTTDKLLAVQAIAFSGGTYPSAVTGLLDEFTISADDTINNDDGTNTTNMLVLITIAAGLPR